MCGLGNYISRPGMVRVVIFAQYYGVLFVSLSLIGWSWESLRDWWQFLKLGLPGIAMICVEWISFEVSAFVLGSIDEVQLGINAVVISILSLLAMVRLLLLHIKD